LPDFQTPAPSKLFFSESVISAEEFLQLMTEKDLEVVLQQPGFII